MFKFFPKTYHEILKPVLAYTGKTEIRSQERYHSADFENKRGHFVLRTLVKQLPEPVKGPKQVSGTEAELCGQHGSEFVQLFVWLHIRKVSDNCITITDSGVCWSHRKIHKFSQHVGGGNLIFYKASRYVPLKSVGHLRTQQDRIQNVQVDD